MQYGIAFTPLVPSFVLWLALAAISCNLLRAAGALARGLATGQSRSSPADPGRSGSANGAQPT